MDNIREQAQESIGKVKEKVERMISDLKSFRLQQDELARSFNEKVKSFITNQKAIVDSVSEAINDQQFKSKLQKLVSNLEVELKKKVSEISSHIKKAQIRTKSKVASKKTTAKTAPATKKKAPKVSAAAGTKKKKSSK